MVIDDEHIVDVLTHPAHVGQALRIDQDYALDVLAAREAFGIDEGQLGAVEGQEGFDVAVDAVRQDGARLGIELVRAQQTGDGVKIRVFVRQDDLCIDG